MLMTAPGLVILLFELQSISKSSLIAAIAKLEHGPKEEWTVEVYVGSREMREANGELARALIRTIYTDTKARDPFTGRLILDQLKELQANKEILDVHIIWVKGKPKIFFLQRWPRPISLLPPIPGLKAPVKPVGRPQSQLPPPRPN